MMDVGVVSEAVAGLLAVGGVKELGEAAGSGLTAGIVDRVKKLFGSDKRSVDALEQAQRDASPAAVAELASALSWYAHRDPAFADELTRWAAQAGVGKVRQIAFAGRDANLAGRDQTVINFRYPSK